MISYILTAGITSIIVWLASAFSFKCYIETQSKKREPTKAFGINYFFMTQDQIQETVKAIFLTEKGLANRYNGDHLCMFDRENHCDIPSWLNKDNCECRFK